MTELFGHDTVGGLTTAADLVNTASRGAEGLGSTDDLDRFLREHATTGGRSRDAADELDRVRAIRPALRGVWEAAGLAERVEGINEMLRVSGARPWLSDHDGTDWHLHMTDPAAPLDQRVLALAAMALADLVRLEASRLRRCAGVECDAVLVDLSRNRSRRFCDIGNCGNRQNVAAYRARRRSAG